MLCWFSNKLANWFIYTNPSPQRSRHSVSTVNLQHNEHNAEQRSEGPFSSQLVSGERCLRVRWVWDETRMLFSSISAEFNKRKIRSETLSASRLSSAAQFSVFFCSEMFISKYHSANYEEWYWPHASAFIKTNGQTVFINTDTKESRPWVMKTDEDIIQTFICQSYYSIIYILNRFW